LTIFDGYFHEVSSCFLFFCAEDNIFVQKVKVKGKWGKASGAEEKVIFIKKICILLLSYSALHTLHKNTFFVCTAGILALYGVPSALFPSINLGELIF
jgi:hypothetical protein